jgi:hypothetical protein
MPIPSAKATPETMPLTNTVLNSVAMNRMTPAQRAAAMKRRRKAGQMQLAGPLAGGDAQGALPASSVLS